MICNIMQSEKISLSSLQLITRWQKLPTATPHGTVWWFQHCPWTCLAACREANCDLNALSHLTFNYHQRFIQNNPKYIELQVRIALLTRMSYPYRFISFKPLSASLSIVLTGRHHTFRSFDFAVHENSPYERDRMCCNRPSISLEFTFTWSVYDQWLCLYKVRDQRVWASVHHGGSTLCCGCSDVGTSSWSWWVFDYFW